MIPFQNINFDEVFMFLLALAVAPVACLLIYIYKRDVIAKEPAKQLVKAFVGGILSAVLAIIVEYIVMLLLNMIPFEGNFFPALSTAFLVAAIPEEMCKFLFLFIFVWRSKDFDEHFDGIVYAVFVSMGFACIENIMYVCTQGTATGILRAITAVPGHFFFAIIMGYYFALAKFEPYNRKPHMIKGIVGAIIAHGIYDFIILYVLRLAGDASSDYSIFIILLVIVFFVFNFKLWKNGFTRIREMREIDIQKLAYINNNNAMQQPKSRLDPIQNEQNPFE